MYNVACRVTRVDVFLCSTIGEVVGTLCNKVGTSVYASSKERILSGIRDNLDIRSRCESESSESSFNSGEQEVGAHTKGLFTHQTQNDFW